MQCRVVLRLARRQPCNGYGVTPERAGKGALIGARVQTLRMLTRAAFHPADPNLLAFSTSRSVLSMIDVRQKDHTGSGAIEFATPSTNVRPPPP